MLKQLVSKPKQNQEIKEIHNEVDLKEVNEVYSKINFVNRNILKKSNKPDMLLANHL